MLDRPGQPLPGPESYDGALGRKIIDLHIWAMQQGLQGAAVDLLFDGLCRRLVGAGVPLWRAFAGMRTLHPQWAGYSYTRSEERRVGKECRSRWSPYH